MFQDAGDSLMMVDGEIHLHDSLMVFLAMNGGPWLQMLMVVHSPNTCAPWPAQSMHWQNWVVLADSHARIDWGSLFRTRNSQSKHKIQLVRNCMVSN